MPRQTRLEGGGEPTLIAAKRRPIIMRKFQMTIKVISLGKCPSKGGKEALAALEPISLRLLP